MLLYRYYAVNRNKRLAPEVFNLYPIAMAPTARCVIKKATMGHEPEKLSVMIHQRLLSWAGASNPSGHHEEMEAFRLKHHTWLGLSLVR